MAEQVESQQPACDVKFHDPYYLEIRNLEARDKETRWWVMGELLNDAGFCEFFHKVEIDGELLYNEIGSSKIYSQSAQLATVKHESPLDNMPTIIEVADQSQVALTRQAIISKLRR